VPLSVDAAGSPSNTMSPWPRPTSVPSYIVIHPAAVWSQYRPMGQKVGAASVLETVSPSNTMWPGPRPIPRPTSVPSYIVIHPAAVWSQYMGQKVGAASVGGTVSPSNTMWPGPRPVPSGIVIHPAVWPQYTNVTRHIDIDRHRSDGILANRSTNGRPKMKQ